MRRKYPRHLPLNQGDLDHPEPPRHGAHPKPPLPNDQSVAPNHRRPRPPRNAAPPVQPVVRAVALLPPNPKDALHPLRNQKVSQLSQAAAVTAVAAAVVAAALARAPVIPVLIVTMMRKRIKSDVF